MLISYVNVYIASRGQAQKICAEQRTHITQTNCR